MTPARFPADAAGDLPGGEHHHAAGKVHHGQGVPAEGGTDEAGVPDLAPQRGAVQGSPTIQVSGADPKGKGWVLRAPRKLKSEKWPLHQSGGLVPQLNRALGEGLEFWGSH